MPDPAVSARQRANILKRYHAPGDSVLVEAEREHAATAIEAYVKKVVDKSPPLTPAQRERIADLLGGHGK